MIITEQQWKKKGMLQKVLFESQCVSDPQLEEKLYYTQPLETAVRLCPRHNH